MTAARGGLDMRRTASFLKRFWKGQGGGTLSDVVIVLAMVGAGLAGIIILFATMYPGLFGAF